MVTLGGCRATDALKEIVYLQTAEVVDYDNPNKYYINDPTSDEYSDQVSATEVQGDLSASEEVQNLVIYSSNPNTDEYTAKQSLFSSTPDFNGIEASSKVNFVKSTDKDAFDHEVTKKEDEDEDQKQEEEEEDPEEAGLAGEGMGLESENGAGGNGSSQVQNENSDDTESEGAQADETAGREARKVDPTRVAYDTSDPSQKPPQVEKVAAYGEYAVIVQMVAGTGALVATDADTLSGSFSKVFDTKKVVQAWSDGGSAKKMDVDKIIASGAQVILTTSSSYLEKLSDKDFGKLVKAGIETVVLRPMTSSQYIKKNVTTVGEMLDGTSAGAYAKNAAKRAQQYVDFHDRVIKECIDANGGHYAGKTVYQSNGKCDVSASGTDESKSTYTVLVDAYDEKATYKGATLGSSGWAPSKGLAYASAGYTTSPVSYYMQCGGLINNAAATTTKSASGSVPLWQFNYNSFGFSSKDWTGITVSLMDDKAIKNMSRCLLDSGINSSNRTGLGSGLGSESFPKLITTSKAIKKSIIENSAKSNGMYTPYGWVGAEGSNRTIESFGVNLGNTVLASTIGVDGTASGEETGNLLGSSIPESAIVVNPGGLFCSWTGGSIESFLEAAWVSDEVNDAADGVDWEKEAKDFYKTFYDYDLTTSSLVN